MKQTVLSLVLACCWLWAPPARADLAPPPDPPEDSTLALVSESERPLGSPPLLAIYILLAALGVRIAMTKTPAEA